MTTRPAFEAALGAVEMTYKSMCNAFNKMGRDSLGSIPARDAMRWRCSMIYQRSSFGSQVPVMRRLN